MVWLHAAYIYIYIYTHAAMELNGAMWCYLTTSMD